MERIEIIIYFQERKGITMPISKEIENKDAVKDILHSIDVMEKALKKLGYNFECNTKKISKKNKKKLNELIKEYVQAAVDYSWVGGANPIDYSEIEENNIETYKKLFNHIESI